MKKKERKNCKEASRKENAWNDSDARCPFFHEHTALTIACESPVPGSSMRMNFGFKNDKKQQYDIFCCGKYEKCEIFRMVMGKYAED